MKIQDVYSKYGTEAAQSCAEFLGPILPKIAPENWWQTTVLDKLPEIQRNNIDGTTIEKLDFLSLLTVFDKNWEEIVSELRKNNKNLKRGGKNIVISMKKPGGFRTHFAHFPVGGLSTEDIIRDLDMLWRFLELVEADEKIIQEIKKINKLGPAHDFDENELERIINSTKQESKETMEKKVKETVSKKPEKTLRTRNDIKASKKMNEETDKKIVKSIKQETNLKEEKTKDMFTYIISSNGINLFHCTYDEIKNKIFNGEIRRDHNIYEVGSTVTAPGPEIGSVSAFTCFFDQLEREQAENRQMKIAKEKEMQENIRKKKIAEQIEQEKKEQEELQRKEIYEKEEKKDSLIAKIIIFFVIVVVVAFFIFLIVSGAFAYLAGLALLIFIIWIIKKLFFD